MSVTLVALGLRCGSRSRTTSFPIGHSGLVAFVFALAFVLAYSSGAGVARSFTALFLTNGTYR